MPAQGQGFSTNAGLGNPSPVATSFQINGFFTGRNVTDVADDSDADVSKEWRVSGPGWSGLTVSDGSGSFDDAFAPESSFSGPCLAGNPCQLEEATLSSGLETSTEHPGFKGSAYVQGWATLGRSASLEVGGLTAGEDYDVVIRYAAGPHNVPPTGDRTLTVALGDATAAAQFPTTSGDNWSTWAESRVTVTADAASQPLSLACEVEGYCAVNVDQIAVVAKGAEVPDAAAIDVTPEMRGISNYSQSLNLKTGAITTSATWKSPSGNVSDVEYTVLTDRSNDQRALVKAKVTPHWSGTLTVTDVLDARPTGNVDSFQQHRDEASNRIGLTTNLRHTGVSATYASILTGEGTLGEASAVPADSVGQALTAEVVDGRSYEFVKYVGLTTSDDEANSYAAASSLAGAAKADGFSAVSDASDAAWAKIWQGDIQVKGNDDLQAQIRASRFYLMASVGTRSWSPSPTGLSSDNYGGHAFWDTETWMWPSIVAQNPDIAAGVLDYRSERLEEAAFNAANTLERSESARGSDDLPAQNNFVRKSYEGLRFPWESGYYGTESTESYFFGGHEIHVSADVALAFWQYYMATGDKQWLAEKGWPVISGTADFWVSRSTAGDDGLFHILDVTPPDEWASNGNNGWDDSAYTNTAASKNLEIAIQAATILGKDVSPGWAERAGRFYIPVDESKGITQEYTGYDGRTIKQGDVVMLSYPWENGQSDAVTAADLDYYAPKVDEHASPSMTDAIHSIVAADLGRADEAYWYTGRSSGGFLRGDFKQFTEERSGGHAFTFITGAGGFLQEFLYGYSGLRWGTDSVTLNPILPSALDEIKLTGLQFQGSTFDVTISKDTTTVAVTAGGTLKLSDGQSVEAGKPLTMDTRKGNDYGTLLGSLTADSGDENGSGDYEYPTNSVFSPKSFDMTEFSVYKDGDSINLVTHVNGQVMNPWGLQGMSLQLVHAYIRSGEATTTGATPAITGTNVNTEKPYQYVAVANPRNDGGLASGLYDAEGTKVASSQIAVRQQHDIVLTFPASAFEGIDWNTASASVLMMSSDENPGENNVRQLRAGSTDEWRFTSPSASDATLANYGNVVKTFVPEGVTQAQALAPAEGGPIVPFVAFKNGADPEPTPEPTDPVTPEPTDSATPKPTDPVTPKPTDPATPKPTDGPTAGPTVKPTTQPTVRPTVRPKPGLPANGH